MSGTSTAPVLARGDGTSTGASTGTRPVLVHTRQELAAALGRLPGPRGLVMTMGALHEGHAELVRQAVRDAGPDGHVVVTVFINPLQFGAGEDLERYPRSLESDLSLCAREGAAVVFAPSAEQMYPGGAPLVRVDPGPIGARLEGESRPGHFAGMLTVVLRMLLLTHADRAYFGEKDYQQLVLVRRAVTDLDVPVLIVGVPTVREPDGLARSSRNRYLLSAQRPAALALRAALESGVAAAAGGRAAVLAAARSVLDATDGVRADRVDLVDPDTLADAEAGPARLLVAGVLDGAVMDGTGLHGAGPDGTAGAVRLIDNAPLTLPRTARTARTARKARKAA